MLTTNLLPPEEQKVITTEKWLRVIRFLGFAGSGMLIIGITLLAPSYLPLYFENRELIHSLALQREAMEKIDANRVMQDAMTIQSTIASLRKSTERPALSLAMFDLFAAPQRGIMITSFAIDNNRNVSFSGNAMTRDDLLRFEQYVRDSARFQDITSPLANIIQEANISFNFQATLKPGLTL